MSRYILILVTMLALVTISCGIGVKLPITKATPSPEVTDQIQVAVPKPGETTRLRLSLGAGKMTLSPGAENMLVSGTVTYNIPDFKPEIKTEGTDVRIKQGDYTFTGIPSFTGIKNEWELKLGDVPMELTIQAGAYDAEYKFGGLALTNLTVQDGASDVNLGFDSPNKSEMAVLRYETGASNVKLTGLGNANFNTLVFKSGAGDYTLDFSGTLKRNGTVMIETGLSNLILVIPEGVPAQVTVDAGLANVNAGSNWTQNGDLYTQGGSGSNLTFVINIGAGNLTLTK